MKALALFLILAPAFAEAPAGQTAAAPAPAAQVAAPASPAPDAANPAPSTEPSFVGSIDFGYRFRTDVRGSEDTYRSIVNLKDGPRLFGIDFTIQDPKRRLFDRITARGSNWGDPYNTAHVDAVKRGIYDLRVDYSNILYFNAVPSFANPLLASGNSFIPLGFNEQSFDVHRRTTSVNLTLLPNKRIEPYFAFDRNSGSGTGITTFVQGANTEFPVLSSLLDTTNNYRGGLHLEFNGWHVTLEEGGLTYANNDSAYTNTPSFGNVTTPLLGQSFLLNSLIDAYGIRGHSVYSKGLLTANPFSWLTFYGQFLYSQPKTDVSYQDAATGNFVLFNPLLFYTGQYDAVTGAANRPHVSGNASVEIRPFQRFRIMESWSTDRFHDAAFANLFAAYSTPPAAATNIASIEPTLEVVNYNRNQTDLFWDLTKRLTLRGGYRYEWGNATVTSSPLSQIGPLETGKLSRQTALAGINFRLLAKLTLNGEYERASTARSYFTTSLYNYNRLRARARYQMGASLSAQARFTLLDNQNPVTGVSYDFRSRDSALSLNWAPKAGKWVSVTAEYDRATMRSRIGYLDLPFLNPAVSVYRDDAHIASGAVELKVPVKGLSAKLTAGGSFVINNGTRASRFYQPLAKLSVPIGKNVYWNSEWQYFGFNEQLFVYEGFRTHLVQTGLRLSK